MLSSFLTLLLIYEALDLPIYLLPTITLRTVALGLDGAQH